jgi:hypothetical protein
MEQIQIERPHSLSLIYFVTDEVYETILLSSSKYSHTGLQMWNDISSNFILSDVKLGVIQSILSNMGALQSTNFSDIYEFLMGIELIDSIEGQEPKRDWPKVYTDLVAAGMRNVKHNGEDAIDWVLDGIIINKEPTPAPAL